MTHRRPNAALPLTPLITHYSAPAKRRATANSTQHSALPCVFLYHSLIRAIATLTTLRR
ncbi:hypothetical protein [Nostoc sp. CENA543]|uniref:hypothetical protein n=1 Tax=Nostoc sp. CENA543 TaxID=1869241 RepID=UPI001CEF5A4F|nr:hypothetical protein [Nostoc sp. CENA543]